MGSGLKKLIIGVVSFFAWAAVVALTAFGYLMGRGYEIPILGAVVGFVFGCFSSGFWFILVQINDRLGVLADAELAKRPREKTLKEKIAELDREEESIRLKGTLAVQRRGGGDGPKNL